MTRPVALLASLLAASVALAAPRPTPAMNAGAPRVVGPQTTPAAPDVLVRAVTLSEQGAGAYRFGVVIGVNTTKGDKPPPEVAALLAGSPVEVELHDREVELTPGPFEGAVSVELQGGSAEGSRYELSLTDTSGAVAWSGVASFGPGARTARWEGAYAEGYGPSDFVVTAAQLHGTAARDIHALSFSVENNGTILVDGGSILSYDGSQRTPIDNLTLTAQDFNFTRAFTSTLRFDGDPVGSVYELSGSVAAPTGNPDTFEGTLGVIRLPGDDVAPGPILGVYGNGRGTRNSASNAGQTMPTGLL